LSASIGEECHGIHGQDFATISAKVHAGERLTADDALALFLEPDLLAIGQLANHVRETRHGDRTFFNKNMRIEVTNVCMASCLFCSFAKLEAHMPGAHTMSLEEAWRELETRIETATHRLEALHEKSTDAR
jgi:aminodeoxyfutalosine synthase